MNRLTLSIGWILRAIVLIR